MSRKLFLTSRLDRVLVCLGMGLALLCALSIRWMIPFTWGDWIGVLLVVGGIWLALYLIFYYYQDQGYHELEEYGRALVDIEYIEGQLSNLADFLRQEHQKVRESQAALARLNEEKAQLEPIVGAQRDVVSAVLLAHSKSTASRIWKERAIGFLTGLIASLLASIVYGYFKYQG